jgi:hypothetical protein
MPSEYAGRVPVGDEVRQGPQLPGRKKGVNRPSGGHLCHSSTVEGYRCYILRAIFLMRSCARLVELHRQLLSYIGRWDPAVTPEPPGSSCGQLSAGNRLTSWPCMGLFPKRGGSLLLGSPFWQTVTRVSSASKNSTYGSHLFLFTDLIVDL